VIIVFVYYVFTALLSITNYTQETELASP
jgi:hypothetical protein